MNRCSHRGKARLSGRGCGSFHKEGLVGWGAGRRPRVEGAWGGDSEEQKQAEP